MAQQTVASVVKYAAVLRQRASRAEVTDVWARPYRPSEAAARKLVQRVGAEEALRTLARKAAEYDMRGRDGESFARSAQEAHERFLRTYEREERRRRERLSYGRRIDDALMQLSLVSGIAATALDTDQISGNTRSDTPMPDDLIPRASTTARLAAESIERELDTARRRTLGSSEPDRDVRLGELAKSGLTAEQISIADPSQGSPSRIRHRIAELGCK